MIKYYDKIKYKCKIGIKIFNINAYYFKLKQVTFAIVHRKLYFQIHILIQYKEKNIHTKITSNKFSATERN